MSFIGFNIILNLFKQVLLMSYFLMARAPQIVLAIRLTTRPLLGIWVYLISRGFLEVARSPEMYMQIKLSLVHSRYVIPLEFMSQCYTSNM